MELILQQAVAELAKVQTKTGLNLLEQAAPEKLAQVVRELLEQHLNLLNETERAP